MMLLKVKSMQISETEAIRTHIQPSKQKREITNITNSQYTKRTYGQPRGSYFQKGGRSATETELKYEGHPISSDNDLIKRKLFL